MRTTLNLDEDVLAAAKELARLRRTTVGKVVSELARKGLRPAPPEAPSRNGVPLLPPTEDEAPVSREIVNRLRDGEPGARA
ncbi:MAG: CopG family transcriptional regulator [Planctomycetota bacterium]